MKKENTAPKMEKVCGKLQRAKYGNECKQCLVQIKKSTLKVISHVVESTIPCLKIRKEAK